jgi:hypothetical protein
MVNRTVRWDRGSRLGGGAQVWGGGVHHDGEDAQHHVDVHGVDVRGQERCLQAANGGVCAHARTKLVCWQTRMLQQHRS